MCTVKLHPCVCRYAFTNAVICCRQFALGACVYSASVFNLLRLGPPPTSLAIFFQAATVPTNVQCTQLKRLRIADAAPPKISRVKYIKIDNDKRKKNKIRSRQGGASRDDETPF